MRTTPRDRPQAFEISDHHMFWKAKEWKHGGYQARRIREFGAFILPTIRWKHDMLHEVVEPISVPAKNICDTVYEIASETPLVPPMETPEGMMTPMERIDNMMTPMERLDSIITDITKEASSEHRHHRSDELLRVAFHLIAQRSILEC